jgi:hypothetical protein
MSEDLSIMEMTAPGPADDVWIVDYRVMPWPDGTRVTVELGLSPFRQFPAMDVSVIQPDGRVLRTASVVGTLERRPAPTLHLPKLERGASLLVLIEMLQGEAVTQQLAVPFEVGGPIVRKVLDENG